MRWNAHLEVFRRQTKEPNRTELGDDRVLDALDALAPDHRTVLILRYLEGRSSREIAMTLGRSERAIDSLTARARAAFALLYRPEAS
jgi:RNA polymerase sigma factor (sigma-70 family)